ncbi:MAG: coenzyme F420 biosynthesis-associated protein [Actinomycetales bacterium]|nr:coenzyme F420 biosynthesis-associated protein [Actinomycetales bacterium]
MTEAVPVEPVDWDLAIATARRLAPKGPDLPAEEARDAVVMLRALAQDAVGPVQEVTGLIAPTTTTAAVVDRSGWIASNVSGMRVVLNTWGAFADKAEAAPAVVRSLGSRGTALQLGAVLAWLSGKVLGQFETFVDPGAPKRLLLVAPTIVHVEQQLGVPSRDFRYWVCLHEETHRVQFGAVPWLADHLTDRITALLEASDLNAREALQRLVAFGYAMVRSLRSESDVSVIEAIQTPEQRVIFDELTALMSLLEGHADVVMDAVGPEVIPSVGLIRERFTHRREQPGALDALARTALGMDAKLRQYSDGAAFVRTAVDAVGMADFNRVWTAPEYLPTRAELHDPHGWLRRVESLP